MFDESLGFMNFSVCITRTENKSPIKNSLKNIHVYICVCVYIHKISYHFVIWIESYTVWHSKESVPSE